ncbi:MAG: hypothetical protein ACKVP0_01630 [Pirellulaceae bacterium]
MSTVIASPSLTCAELAEQLLRQSPNARPTAHLPTSRPNEFRRSSRRNFVCWQLVAEYDGKTLPVQQDFHLRLCQDISAGGISFLANERPRTEDLVIALGAIPFVFLHVRFVRAVRRKDLEGQPLLVGCKYIKRIVG